MWRVKCCLPQIFAILFSIASFEIALAKDVDKFEMVGISSEKLPNGLELKIEHNRDWEISDLRSQADYQFLLYSFTQNGKKVGTARVYMDDMYKISFFPEKEVTLDSDGVADCFRSLLALGFIEIDTLASDGYQTVNLDALGITIENVLDWARLMDTEASNRQDK